MMGQTIHYTNTELEKKYVCPECSIAVEDCDQCFQQLSGECICFNQGAEHFCSEECMRKFKKKNYSKDDEIEEE